MLKTKNLIFVLSAVSTLAFLKVSPVSAYDSSNARRIQNMIESNMRYYTADSDFGGKAIIQLYNNDNYHSNNKDNEYAQSHIKTDLFMDLRLNKYLSANALLKVDQVEPKSGSTSSHNRSFENEAGYIEELTIDYDQKNLSLLLGKFTLDFGRGYNWHGGIWNSDIAQNNYEFNEKIGGSILLKAGDRKTNGQYILNFSSFVNDRKYLTRSIITQKNVASKSDAVPGDDRGFGSYNASLNILYDFGNEEKLSYHFSYLNLAVNKRQSQLPTERIADEKGMALNMNYRYPFSKNFLLDGFIEYVSLKNVNGDAHLENNFLTTTLTFNLYQNWLITASNVKETMHQTGIIPGTNQINELSFGYKFNQDSSLDGLQILLGYKQNEIDDNIIQEKTNSIGILLRYLRKF